MTYPEFKQVLDQELKRSPDGRTWVELKTRLRLPYERACPEWTRRLEEDIGLRRVKGAGRALVWMV